MTKATAEAQTSYPTVLHRLIAEAEALTPEAIVAQMPTTDRARNEAPIDVLPEPLQALCALLGTKQDAVNVLAKEQAAMREAVSEENPLDQEAHDAIAKQAEPLAKDIELLGTVLWMSIREQMDWDPDAPHGQAIRAGWEVVDCYGTKGSSGFPAGLVSILKGFFGD